MKIVYLGIILTFLLVAMSYAKSIHAESSDPVQILNVQVQPNIIKVNDTFSFNMTILNNSTFPIYLTSGSCTPAFSVVFDAHAKQVYQNITCTTEAILQKVDPQSQVIISNANKPGVIYQAVQPGTATVNITLPYYAKNQTATDYSNIYYNASKSFQFQIHDVNSDSSGPPVPMPGTIPPLQQFRSGITTNHIICKKDLYVILKAENNFPACVDIETGKKLVQRGWATAFGINMNDYWSTCNKSFPQTDSSTSVLYMPVNSIGKICLRYSNYDNEPETVTPPRNI